MSREWAADGDRIVTTDDGVRLWTTVSGNGPPLLLSHGGPGLWDYLEAVAAMAEDRHAVVRWDQRGCGRSGSGRPQTAERSVRDIESIRSSLDTDDWVVGGHSWGGLLALLYALTHPDQTKAVLCLNTMAPGRAWRRSYHQESERRAGPERCATIRTLEERDRSEGEERLYRRLRWASDFDQYEEGLKLAGQLDRPYPINPEANRSIGDEMANIDVEALARRCTQLSMPVLVLHGDRDPRPLWGLDPVLQALPDVRVEIVHGAGHMPWLEAPDKVERALRAFLESVAPSSD